MLRSCKYCGRVHDDRALCEPKIAALERAAKIKSAQRNTKSHPDTREARFRSTQDWTKRSVQVRERDHYLCLCCAAGLRGTTRRYNDGSDSGGLEVHHIIPIKEDDSLRLDESNLLTVCRYHHYLCEIGAIPRSKQQQLVSDSIKKAQALGIQGY